MAVHDQFCKSGHIDVTLNMILCVSNALRKLIIFRDGGDLYAGQELRILFFLWCHFVHSVASIWDLCLASSSYS